MYVEPNTIVKLMKNVPLFPDYENTYYFTSKAQQISYFNSLSDSELTFEKQYFQRYRKNAIQLNVKQNAVIGCNYMAFQNTNHSNKWFYAFILSTEYINDNNTAIFYQIDEMQTWFFDYELQMCMVERQHSETDEAGDNIVPEKIEVGEYDENDRYDHLIGLVSDCYTVIWATFDENLNDRHGVTINGYYTPLYPIRFEREAGTEIASFLIRVAQAGKNDGILQISYVPKFLFGSNTTFEVNLPKHNTNEEFGYGNDTYIPKNKKLYTYPYNYFHVVSPNTDTSYAYEFFNGNSCSFRVSGYPQANTSVICVPFNYKGSGDYFENMSQILSFPSLAYVLNSYEQFIAEYNATKKQQLGRSLIRAGITLGTASISAALVNQKQDRIDNAYQKSQSITAKELMGRGDAAREAAAFGLAQAAVNSASSGVSWFLDKAAEEKIEALNTVSQSGTTDDLTGYNQGYFNFIAKRLSIRAEKCRMIDGIFALYGYAQNKVMIPKQMCRLNWSYVKTANCQIKNFNIPAVSAEIIKNIYNNGIRFWKAGYDIGNYGDLSNPVT